MKRRIAAMVALSVLLAGHAPAEMRTFRIDPVHSSVQFRIRHLYTHFAGRFNRYSGTIIVDPEDLTSLKLSTRIDVSSIDTANADRDAHLRAPDFFDTKTFATATFESTKTLPVDGDTVKVVGNMTIRGKTKEVTFTAKKLGYGPDHRKGRRCGIHATTTINRLDFGVSYGGKVPNGLSVLGNDVEIVADIEAIEIEEPTAAETVEPLAPQISAFKAKQSTPLPKDTRDALDRAAKKIAAQGNIGGLKVGDKAPDFSLPTIEGKTISLSAVLEKGPVVLVFYRGEWCPYCNLQLRALQQAYADIRKAGGELLAISPQKVEKAEVQVTKNHLSFPLLTDSSGSTMRAYRLLYQIPPEMRQVYLTTYNIDLAEYNGEGRWELPVTATFVIGRDGRIEAGMVDLDYTKRMEPRDILAAVAALKD